MKIEPNYSSWEILQFTYDMAHEVISKGIKGDLVECGVASGNQLGKMQECLTNHNEIRTVWGFDSFQGIPYASEHDTTQPGIGAVDKNKFGLLESTGITVHSKQSVIDNFIRWGLRTDNLRLIEGWFENTVKDAEVGDIALLRLDGDLYSSTKVCLKAFYHKVSKGGVIIIDDWQLDGCRKAILEFIPKKKIREIHGIAYTIK